MSQRDSSEQLVPGKKVRCPHCGVVVQLLQTQVNIGGTGFHVSSTVSLRSDDNIYLHLSECPSCKKVIIQLRHNGAYRLVVPRVKHGRLIRDAVPSDLVKDFDEATLVIGDSPNASAAISRRCLQSLLMKQGFRQRDLKEQIDAAYPSFPSYVQGSVDHIRNLGNIAAHPKNDIATDRVVDVEPGEAEWLLEVLGELLDHYYVKPAEAKAKNAAILEKIASMKRPHATSSALAKPTGRP